MGMLIDGKWSQEDRIIEDGQYRRSDSVHGHKISTNTLVQMRLNSGRFHLLGSLSCQWSHRAMIVRNLKGLNERVPLHIAHGARIEGYAVDGGRTWTVPGTDSGIVHLHQLYTMDDPHYCGRVTVPVLWDARERRIVSNESARIMRAFDDIEASDPRQDFTLVPNDLEPEIEALNQVIYEGLGNGVYRAGFAQNQRAYDDAIGQVFSTLDQLEDRLATRRYLFENTITDADWRLFVTLVRFDCVYFVLHRCSKRRLIDYPHLWAYARDLYSWSGTSETTDFDVMRSAGYLNDTDNNPRKIVAIAPDVNWLEPHGRRAFGEALVARRDGCRIPINPSTLQLLDAT